MPESFCQMADNRQRISLNRGTPFRKACLKGGAGAVPAGGIANPHPGGSGAPLGRQKDRSARSSLDWTGPRRAKHPPQPRPRKRGSGAEPEAVATALASAVAKRRKASAPRNWRAAAKADELRRLRILVCDARTMVGMRLSALRLPFLPEASL